MFKQLEAAINEIIRCSVLLISFWPGVVILSVKQYENNALNNEYGSQESVQGQKNVMIVILIKLARTQTMQEWRVLQNIDILLINGL